MIPESPIIEQHRRACEARHYLRMPGVARVAALERIAKKRGDAAAKMLADDIRAERAKAMARCEHNGEMTVG